MSTAPPVSVHDDLGLWARAVAAFAILLQSLLLGFLASDDAMPRTMDRASMAMAMHDSMAQRGQHDGQTSPCPFAVVCCTGLLAMGPPALPPALAPSLTAAIALRRPPRVGGRRKTPHRGAHSARGPPGIR